VAIGEFGRTPKINKKGGRDHWGPVFSLAMAGAGISGGQVYGASDKNGGHPIENRVQPGDLTATMFHLLGINYQSTFRDREGREHRLTQCKPLFKLLGEHPATDQRTKSTGNVDRVPPFDPSVTLLQTDFTGDVPVRPLDTPSRPKGWRGDSLDAKQAFGIRVVDNQAAIGLHADEVKQPAVLKKGDSAILAQEVRSPFAGTYSLRVRMRGEASSKQEFQERFQKHFTCRLQFFQFTSQSKNAAERKVLASVDTQPAFTSDPGEFQEFEFTKEFVNPKPGSNFSFGLGMGVAVIVEKTSGAELQIAAGQSPLARIRIRDVALEFSGKERNEKVKV